MCTRWSSDVLLDYVQGRLDAHQARQVADHLPACPSCRSVADDLLSLSGLLTAPALEPSEKADRAIREEIGRISDRRFAESVLPVDEASKPTRPGTRRIRIFRRAAGRRREASGVHVFWAAAAALLVSFAILFASMSGGSPARERGTANVAPTPEKPEPPTAKVERRLPPEKPTERKRIPVPPRSGERTLRDPEPFRAPPPARLPEAPRQAPKQAPPVPNPRTIVKESPKATVTETRVEFASILGLSGRTEADGSALKAGDTIFTGQELSCRMGHALLRTEDGSLIALKAGTRVVPGRSADHVTLALSEGEVACSVRKRPERRFAVATSLGTATVRGTIFSVRAIRAATIVTVSEGRVEARNKTGVRDVPAGFRSTIRGLGRPGRLEPVKAHRALAWAYEAGLRSLDRIWILADAKAELQAPMTRGKLDGSLSAAPLFARVDSQKLAGWKGRFLPADQDDGGWVTYTLDVPDTGVWYLWGRMFYPGAGNTLWRQNGPVAENDPNSFYVRVDGGPEMVFGNLKREAAGGISWYRRWHWNGDGRVEVGSPAPLRLGTLQKGSHTIRIRNRDAVETAGQHLAPRLDALCLTRDPAYVPQDEEVIR